MLKCLNAPADKTVHLALQEAGRFPPLGNASQPFMIAVAGAVACLGQQWLTCHTEDTPLLDLLPCLTDHVFFVCLSGYEGDPEKLQFCPEVQFALLLRVCC